MTSMEMRAIVILAAVIGLIGYWQVKWSIEQRRRREQACKDVRGFEVKLNTGKSPVPEKKEIDHG